MKALLVATDFSESADQAADYACKFAGQLGTNVQLIHASSIDTDSPLQAIWPIEDQDTTISRNDALLETFSQRLHDSVIASSGPDAYVPAIRIRSAAGEVSDLIRETVQLENIAMVILGLSGNGDLKRLIHGSCSRDSIDFAEYPLLLIPQNAKFVPVKKIAFATDLSISDMEIIQLLALLAAKLNAELLIVHVISKREDLELTHRIDTFMKELKSRVNHNQMYYKNVYQSNLEEGLNWLYDHGGTNIVAVIHRKNSSKSNILHSSYAQKMARHTHLPLIVIPEGYKGMLF